MGIQPGGDFPSTILSSIFSSFFYFGYYIQCLCKMEHLVGSSPWGEGQLKLVITKTENKNTRSWFAKYFSFSLCYYFPTIFFIFYKALWTFPFTLNFCGYNPCHKKLARPYIVQIFSEP